MISTLVQHGILIQINSGSLLGVFGRRISSFAWELIDNGLVHFIASDAHNTRGRSFSLNAAWEEVYEQYGEDMAEKLFYTNPLNVLFAEKVEAVKSDK